MAGLATMAGLTSVVGAAGLWVLTGVATTAVAEPWTFTVQAPYRDGAHPRYTALAALLSGVVARPVRVTVHAQPLAHQRAAGDGSQLVLEEAHLAGARIARSGHRGVVMAREARAYAVMVAANETVLEPEDLIGRRVATPAPPYLGALALLELFPNPIRIPDLEIHERPASAMRALRRGRVAAAVVPYRAGSGVSGTRVLLFTEEFPGRVLTVSPEVSETQRAALLAALLEAAGHARGRRALEEARIGGFDPVGETDLEGLARFLRGAWPTPRATVREAG